MDSYLDKIILHFKDFENNFHKLNTVYKEYIRNNPDLLDTLEEIEIDDVEITIKKDLFLQDAEKSIVEAIKLLSFSLLSGEYIYDENLKIKLSKIEDSIKEFIKDSDYLTNELKTKIFDYSSCISITIEGYKIFIQDTIDGYSEDRVEYLFTQNNQFEKEIKESDLSDTSDNLIDFFFLLLSLTNIDHFPSNENKDITILFELEKKLKNVKIVEYNDLLKEVCIKINFLKHKWKSRKLNENPLSNAYLDDGNIKTLEDFNDDNEKLKVWSDIIETQYELISRNWVSILETRVKPFKNKDLTTLKVLEIHQLIKYYKDVKPNYNKLEEISKFLSTKIGTGSNIYDKYANNITYNYALNNSFSLYLENTNDLDAIKHKYLKIKDKIKGETNNFFLEHKYLEYITKDLLIKINEEDKIKYIQKYDNIIISHCKEEVELYFSKKQWSKLNHNYVFILPIEECLVPCSVDGLSHIFYASSFVLPPSNNKIEKDYISIKEKYDKLILFIDTSKYFRKEFDKIDELNKELDQKDFKSIEIISIFTAIITFVLSSIPTYKFVQSVFEALLFMLSLATALAIFITLVLFSTRDLYKKWIAYVPVTILLFVCYFGFSTLTNFEKKEYKIDNVTNKKIDSISSVKVDSILKFRDIKIPKVKK